MNVRLQYSYKLWRKKLADSCGDCCFILSMDTVKQNLVCLGVLALEDHSIILTLRLYCLLIYDIMEFIIILTPPFLPSWISFSFLFISFEVILFANHNHVIMVIRILVILVSITWTLYNRASNMYFKNRVNQMPLVYSLIHGI